MRRKRRSYHGRQKTHQEMMANLPDENGKVWCRAKRLPHRLDHWNNEREHKLQKSWKFRRGEQYHVAGSKGNRYTFVTGYWSQKWKLVSYLEDRDIPHRVEKVCERYTRTWWQTTEKVAWYRVPVYGYYHWRKAGKEFGDTRQRGWKTVYREVTLPQPIPHTYTYSTMLEFRISWWHTSNIQAEKIAAGLY